MLKIMYNKDELIYNNACCSVYVYVKVPRLWITTNVLYSILLLAANVPHVST